MQAGEWAVEAEGVAPDIEVDYWVRGAPSTQRMSLRDHRGDWVVLFFYPLDFTFVCPSELIALSNRTKKLNSLEVEVLAISIDSHHTHFAWRNTSINDGGIGPVAYTLAADMDHSISQAYGIQSDARAGLGVSYG